jgi:hypothetical protein
MHLVFNVIALKGELIVRGKRRVHELTDQGLYRPLAASFVLLKRNQLIVAKLGQIWGLKSHWPGLRSPAFHQLLYRRIFTPRGWWVT